MLSWLKFCYSGSVSVFAHFPFSSRRYGIVIRDILGRKLPDVVEMDEYERLHAIQISNHRTSTFCSSKPIGPIYAHTFYRDYRTTHCIVNPADRHRSCRILVLTCFVVRFALEAFYIWIFRYFFKAIYFENNKTEEFKT